MRKRKIPLFSFHFQPIYLLGLALSYKRFVCKSVSMIRAWLYAFGLNLKSFSINFYDFTFGLFFLSIVVAVIAFFRSLNGSTLTAFQSALFSYQCCYWLYFLYDLMCDFSINDDVFEFTSFVECSIRVNINKATFFVVSFPHNLTCWTKDVSLRIKSFMIKNETDKFFGDGFCVKV